MRRRAALLRTAALAGTGAALWAAAARAAEPAAPRWRIGWLGAGRAPASGSRGTLELLQVALRERGLAPGEALQIDVRFADNTFVRGWPQEGGLLAYAPNLEEVARQMAAMIDAILRRGAKPAEMPVQQIARLDLLLNRQTARAIGLKLPNSLLARATEVIG